MFCEGKDPLFQKTSFRLLLSLLFGAAAYGASWLPYASSFAAPALMVVSAACGGFPGALLAGGVFAALTLAVDGAGLLTLAVYAVVTALCAAAAFRFARRSFHALVGSCGAVLAGMWAQVLAGFLLYGAASVEALFTVDAQAMPVLEAYYSLAGLNASSAAAAAAETAALYGEMVPAVFLVTAMAAGLVGFALGVPFFKGKTQFQVPRFSRWAMPKGHFLGAVLLVVVAYGGRALGLPGFSSVALAVNLFILFAYSVQGLAVLWFLFSTSRLRLPARLIFTVVLGVVVNTNLVLVYLLDELLMVRKRLPPGSASK